MQVKIIETGEKEELIIIDPENGVDWINDMMGNHGCLPEHDDEADCYIMKKEDFEWWKDLTSEFQKADDRYYELLNSLNGENYNSLFESVQNINVDLEDFPRAVQEICDQYEKKK